MGFRLIWLNFCVWVYSTLFWLYGIAYQLAFPIGITEGHPIAHWDILNSIRVHNPNWRISNDENYVLKVVELMKERVKSLLDMQELTAIFFEDPNTYDEKAVKKKWKDKSVNKLIAKFENLLDKIELWDAEQIEIVLRNLAECEEISAGKIIHPTRLALSGTGSGPSLFDMMELLGKEVCLRRLQKAIDLLPY